jgi:peptidoglycan LD-endopeptidase CwlK
VSIVPTFGRRSIERLKEAHPDLQRIANELIKEMDVTVLCAYRGKAAQDEANRTGFSKVRWPNSAHNVRPSRAIDIAPYPIEWEDEAAFLEMRKRIETIAARLGIRLRSLIKWDLPHTELR